MRKEIYLAGGYFWGMQSYFDAVKGVEETAVGYANGYFANPTYEHVCKGNTGFAETLKIEYEENKISLLFLLSLYYDIIDPTILNRQGHDIGSQYRTGIYYVNADDKAIIAHSLHELEKHYQEPIVVEWLPLRNFYQAETYHQAYLQKNPNGYCHISRDKIETVKTIVPTPNFQKR